MISIAKIKHIVGIHNGMMFLSDTAMAAPIIVALKYSFHKFLFVISAYALIAIRYMIETLIITTTTSAKNNHTTKIIKPKNNASAMNDGHILANNILLNLKCSETLIY